MNSDKDVVLDFIEHHKRGICFLMGVSEKGLKEQDIKIMLSYLTYKSGVSSRAGEFDLSIIADLEKLPPEKRCEAVLLKSCEWFESGQLFSRTPASFLNDELKFSDRVERALSVRYEAKLKREFGELSNSVLRMKKHTAKLISILRTNDDLRSPDVVKQIQSEFKSIRSAIQSANYRAKAGLLWANRHGLPMETSIKSIAIVYLRHLKDLAPTMKAVDQHLKNNKIRTNGEEMVVKHYDRWYNDLNDAMETRNEKKAYKSNENRSLAYG